ncbi:amidohydrolase family protein [Pelagibacterium sp. 26DY04]|uniref:amidohydrolase family protein n=1 Tax=Pelagibacterium sp. 26DY04 TaxID=2967130 RepID=UPI002814B80F|nr:amidohydrolase family protein [Pelagibacterium sp. 26DY04]WMT85904.1 amidohydrolase family protein [Pelagibacterium sp. 26DY04]
MTDQSDISIIDSHFHIWDPDRGDYGWLTGPFAPIRRVFMPADFAAAAQPAGVIGGVLVQTWASVEETREFLALAEANREIMGVVGWVDLCAPDVGDVLDQLLAGPGGLYLKAVRHLVHNEPDADWLGRADVRNGLQAVAERGLAYDLLIRPREIPASIALAKAMPELRLVVDHIAKPAIARGEYRQWAEPFAGFAELPNVACKLSGMVTEADLSGWTQEQLAPYFNRALEIFGPDRLMTGSDWPVCLVATDYAGAIDLVRDAIAPLSPDEQRAVLQTCTKHFYKLEPGSET